MTSLDMLSPGVIGMIALNLPVVDLKNFNLVNKRWNRTLTCLKIWKRRCQMDFPTEFSKLPVYLNEPNWRRVYNHIFRQQQLKNKFTFHSHNIPYELDDDFLLCRQTDIDFSHSGISYSHLLAVLFGLGAVKINNHIELSGTYHGLTDYDFVIHNKNFFQSSERLYCTMDISRLAKNSSIIINEFLEYLMFEQPTNFDIQLANERFFWRTLSTEEELFHLYLPSDDILQLYQYYYLPKFMVEFTSVYVSDCEEEYISKVITQTNEIILDITADVFTTCLDIMYPKVRYKRCVKIKTQINSKYEIAGNFIGTVFVVYIKNNDNCVYLKVNAEYPQPLINKLMDFFRSAN